MRFLLATTILVQALLTKFVFLRQEPTYGHEMLSIVDFGLLALLSSIGIISFLFFDKHRIGKSAEKREGVKPAKILLISLGLMFVLVSFLINFKKTTLEWDAIALFDARAVYLEKGLNFKDIYSLLKYDPSNQNYYLSYPPHTTVVHYLWKINNIDIPIGVYYSSTFLLLILSTYFLSKPVMGETGALVVAVLTATNKEIFQISLLEYSNLPFTLNIVAGVLLLANFLKHKEEWTFYCGTVLIASSLWIRFLEPIWLIVAIVFLFSTVTKRSIIRSLLKPTILITAGLLSYVSWINFRNILSGSLEYVPLMTRMFNKMIEGLFNGSIIKVALELFRGWGILSLGYLLTLLIGIVLWRAVLRRKELLFLFCTIGLSLGFYLVAIYHYSLRAQGWESLALSISRSSVFLIPLTGIFLLSLFKYARRQNE